MVTSHTHLAVVWCVEDVNSAGFDSVGLGPPVQSEAALPPPPVPTGQRTIVPTENTKTSTQRGYIISEREYRMYPIHLM